VIFSTNSTIHNLKIKLPEEILKTLSIENDQILYSYLDIKSRKILLSTIPVTERLHFFRIPFIDIRGKFSKIAGIFRKYHANIEKSDDVSLGSYAIWNVWITFNARHSDLEEFDDNYIKLIQDLQYLIPQHLKESGAEVIHISFNERKALFTSQTWEKILETEDEIVVSKNKAKIKEGYMTELGLTKEVETSLIMTLYDEFPFIIIQYIQDEIILTKLEIRDKPGTLSDLSKLLSDYISLKASDTIIKKSGFSSEWKLYASLINGKSYKEYSEYLNQLKEERSDLLINIKHIKKIG